MILHLRPRFVSVALRCALPICTGRLTTPDTTYSNLGLPHSTERAESQGSLHSCTDEGACSRHRRR